MPISTVYVVTRGEREFQSIPAQHLEGLAKRPVESTTIYRTTKSSACPRLFLRRLVPTPNIQPNLRPRRDRVRGMPGLRVPGPIGTQILPEDRITLDRFEGDPFPGRACMSIRPSSRPGVIPILTLQKPTPLLPRRHPQTREIGTSALAVRPQIHHEGAEAVAASSE